MTGADARDEDEEHHDSGDLHENPGRAPAALAPGAQTGQSEGKDRTQHPRSQPSQRPWPNIDGLVRKQVQERARQQGESPSRDDHRGREWGDDQLGAGSGDVFTLVTDKHSEDDEGSCHIERYPQPERDVAVNEAIPMQIVAIPISAANVATGGKPPATVCQQRANAARTKK